MKQSLSKYHRIKNGKVPSDEYYTKYEEVEHIMNNILFKEDFKDKIVYMPADGEQSNFVKYFKDHKDEIQYKELIYTSDDMMTHEDLFQYADIIITNPPFSILASSILPLLKRNNCIFFLFGSLINIKLYIDIFSPYELKYIRRGDFSFILPFINEQTGTNEAFVAGTIFMTNLNIQSSFKEYEPKKKFLSKTFEEINHIYCLDEDTPYLIIDKMYDFPNDYYEPVWATISVLQYKYSKYFDYLYPIDKKNGKHKIYCAKSSDNKNRFLRFLVQRKKDSIMHI